MVDVEAFLVDGMVCIIILAPFLPLSRACKKTEWWDAGMVVCLGQGADFHMAQLMPLPLTISYSSKSRLVLPFWWYLSGASSPGYTHTHNHFTALCVCVCVCVCMCVCVCVCVCMCLLLNAHTETLAIDTVCSFVHSNWLLNEVFLKFYCQCQYQSIFMVLKRLYCNYCGGGGRGGVFQL